MKVECIFERDSDTKEIIKNVEGTKVISSIRITAENHDEAMYLIGYFHCSEKDMRLFDSEDKDETYLELY